MPKHNLDRKANTYRYLCLISLMADDSLGEVYKDDENELKINFRTFSSTLKVIVASYLIALGCGVGLFFSFKPILKGEVFEELLKIIGLVIGFSATALFYYFDRFDQEKREMIRLFPLAIRSYKLATGLSRQEIQEIDKNIEKVSIEYDTLGELLDKSIPKSDDEKAELIKAKEELLDARKYLEQGKQPFEQRRNAIKELSLYDKRIVDCYDKVEQLLKMGLYLAITISGIGVFISILALASQGLNLERFQLTFLFLAIVSIPNILSILYTTLLESYRFSVTSRSIWIHLKDYILEAKA